MITATRAIILSISFLSIVACSNDLDKAKKFGFISVEQMNYLNSLGFKNMDEFKAAHPYSTESSSEKYAEAGLGLQAKMIGVLKPSDSGDYFEGPNGTWMNADANGGVSVIGYSCIINRSKIKSTVDGVGCDTDAAEIKTKITSKVASFCGVENYNEIKVYVKNKAFFIVKNDDGKIEAMGLLKSPGDLIYSQQSYEPCEKLFAKIEASKLAGFGSIYEMEEAASKGFKTGQEWRKFLVQKKFDNIRVQASNLLEKALVIHSSTAEDARAHKEDGGLNKLSSWRGFMVQSYEIIYKENRASIILMSVDRLLEFGKEINYPSVNNIKKILVPECGTDWKLGMASNHDAYLSKTEETECRFYEDKRRGGMFIEISAPSK